MSLKKVTLFFFLLSYAFIAKAQNMLLNNKYSVESSMFLSTTDRLPFWLRSNQYGEVPLEAQFLQLGAEMQHEYDSTYTIAKKLNKFSYGYGARGIANVGKVNQFRLTEAFAKVRYGSFELYAGRRREIVALTDSIYSSGSFSISKNAQPITQIKLLTPNYINVFGMKYLSVKMGYSHGWFNLQNNLKGVLLHQKSIYAKLGTERWKIVFLAGFNHQVQFGGKFKDNRQLSSINKGYFPKSFQDYIWVVSGIPLGSLKTVSKIDSTKYTSYDLTNRVGNHLGTIDLAARINLKKASILLYRQSFYDDGSLFYLNNISDGLSGISITKKSAATSFFSFNNLNIEYFNSSSQGGNLGPEKTVINQLRGWDDYYNHGQFIDGWSNKGFTLGNPFIEPQEGLSTNLPSNIYNNSKDSIVFYSNNNRIKAFSTSLSLNINFRTLIILKNSVTKNYGTYRTPFSQPIYQFSHSLEGQKKINTIKVNSILAFNSLGIYNKTLGFKISICKTF